MRIFETGEHALVSSSSKAKPKSTNGMAYLHNSDYGKIVKCCNYVLF